MKNISIYKVLAGIAVCCLLAALWRITQGGIATAGTFIIAFFLTSAIAFRGSKTLRGFSYTVIIFAAVTSALYYPQYFVQVNGFKLSTLITPLLQLIMFGMGTSMGLKDFAGVIKMPKGVFIGVGSHFIIMPLLGFTLAKRVISRLRSLPGSSWWVVHQMAWPPM